MLIISLILFLYSILNLTFLDNIHTDQNVSTLVVTHLILLSITFFRQKNFQNTFLWFHFMYFLLISFSPTLIMIGLIDVQDILNLRTNFFNSISEASFNMAIALSNFAISFLTLLYLLFPFKDLSKIEIVSYPRLYNFFMPLLLLILPLMFFLAYKNALYVIQTGYAGIYLGLKPEFLPFESVFTNISTILFYLVFASKPSKKVFIFVSVLFLVLKFSEAIVGARSAFILSFFSIIWFWSVLYKAGKIPILISSLSLTVLLIFSIFVTSNRDKEASNFDATEITLVSSLLGIGKGLETFSIYIDNKKLVDQKEIFIFQPIIFPIKYIAGERMVGQSEETIQNRKNLNHQLSYALNAGAYLSGAGLGSSFLAESYQYGIFFFILSLTMFFFFYKLIFDNIEKIYLRALALPLFTHFIFTPRDHAFINFYLFIKYLPIIFIIFMFLYGIKLSYKSSFSRLY